MAVYQDLKSDLSDLARSLPDDELAMKLAASPGWSTKDVIAHVTGIVEEMVFARDGSGGAMPESWKDDDARNRLDAFTDTTVSPRNEKPLAEILAEWDDLTSRAAAMIAGDAPQPEGFNPLADTVMTTDLIVHHQDVRNGLGRPGKRDVGAGIAIASYSFLIHMRLDELGLGALELHFDDKTKTVGTGTAGATVEASKFELSRAFSGRRSHDQIAAFEWTGDAAKYIDVIPAYGPRTDDLVE